MKITPQKIREIYRSSAPYQIEKTMENYVGQKISWDLELFSVRERGDELEVSLGLGTEIITCTIKESTFPLIKLLPKSAPVRLIGEIAGIASMWIDIKKAQLQEIKNENGQIYFPEGSRESLLAFLQGKISGAHNIKIYDSYPDEEILRLLESAAPDAEIQLLGKDINSSFSETIKAFGIYFKRNMIAKKTNVSHARFYIIDGEVFQVDTSLKNYGGNKATMIHKIDMPNEIIKDFAKWWNEATSI